jgi:hypothetical protein
MTRANDKSGNGDRSVRVSPDSQIPDFPLLRCISTEKNPRYERRFIDPSIIYNILIALQLTTLVHDSVHDPSTGRGT